MRRKVRESNQTGSGGTKLTELDNLILDAIGRDSPYMTGIDRGADDPPPSVHSSQSNLPPPAATDDSQSQSEFEFRRPFQDLTGRYLF